MSKLVKVNRIAKKMGITEKIQISTQKSKKFMVRYNGKLIHFGATGYEDFLDHKDATRRKSYLARARGIRDKRGRLTHKNKNSANFWAINILW